MSDVKPTNPKDAAKGDGMMVNKNWAWWSSRDQERYNGPFSTREDAINDLGGDLGWICEAYQPILKMSDFCGFDKLADNVSNQSAESDYVDPCGDGELFDVSSEQWNILEVRLKSVVDQWQEECGVTSAAWSFAEQRNVEKIETSNDQS